MATRIVGDWGTTRLRLFRLEDGRVADRREGPGIGQLTVLPADALAETLGDWHMLAQTGGVTLCGMAGSRNGLIEVPYAPCPADAGAWAERTGTTEVAGAPVRVAAGLSTANFSGAPDVIRGEETQLFGAIALRPDLAQGRHLIVLPGTHSKWAEIDGGRIARFHTAFTGELFALLSQHSTLAKAGTDPAGRDEGFAAGLARIADKGALLSSVFEARAAQLIDGRPQGWAMGFLSGLLIGGEIREMLALSGHRPERLSLCGDAKLGALYAQACEGLGIATEALDGDACVLEGLALLGRLAEG